MNDQAQMGQSIDSALESALDTADDPEFQTFLKEKIAKYRDLHKEMSGHPVVSAQRQDLYSKVQKESQHLLRYYKWLTVYSVMDL